jgi:hypothetical protein
MRAGVRFLVIATPPMRRIGDRQARLKTPSVERLPRLQHRAALAGYGDVDVIAFVIQGAYDFPISAVRTVHWARRCEPLLPAMPLVNPGRVVAVLLSMLPNQR